MPGNRSSHARPSETWPACGREVSAKHKSEVEAGTVGAPLALQDVRLDEILLVERFGVSETRGGRTKVRVIDNFKKNEVNTFASMHEKVWNDTHDHLTHAVLSLLQHGCTDVLIGKDDFVSAFKTVCPDFHQSWLMWCLVYDTDNLEWKVSEMCTQPFGAVGGVYAWWRCAQAIKCVFSPPFSSCVVRVRGRHVPR